MKKPKMKKPNFKRKKYMTLKLDDKQATCVVAALLEIKELISKNIKEETKDKEIVEKLCDEIIEKKMDLV